MKKSVEERVVQMRFDNEQFEKGAEQSLRTLGKLENVLDMLGSGGAGLSRVGEAIDTIADRFSTMGIVGMNVITNLTHAAMSLAENLLLAIPRQIVEGGKTRALNIEQARFQLKGLGVAWDEVSDDIDHAVLGTAYGMDEAAIVASQLAASGVQYKNVEGEISDMGRILRGISGVAAMTNSSYGEIGHIFTGIAGTGHVMTQDLRMLEGRGLNVAAKLAAVLNETTGTAKYTEETIREMVSKGQVDFLTFARAMDYAFGEHATAANETYTGSLSNMKAALSRIGADFATPTFEFLRQMQNKLRDVFNEVRKITKPFAEGKYTQFLTNLAPTALNILDKIQNGIAKVHNLTDAFFKLFNPMRKINELNEDGTEQFWIDKDALRRIQNLRDALQGLKLIFQNIKDVATVAGFAFKNVFGESTIGQKLLGGFDALLEKIGNAGRKIIDFGQIFKWFSKSSQGNKGDWLYDEIMGGFVSEEGRKRFLGLKNAFIEFFTDIKRVGDSGVRIFKASFDIIKTVITDVFNAIKTFLPSSEQLGSGFSKLGEFIASASEKLADWIEKIRDAVKEHTVFTTIAETIQKAFEGIASSVKWVSDFTRDLLGLQEGETIFSHFGNTISTVGDKIGSGLAYIKDSLFSAFEGQGVGGGTIMKVIGGIVTAFTAFRKLEKTNWAIANAKRPFSMLFGDGVFGNTLFNTKGAFWKDLKGLAMLPDKIATVLGRTSGALRAFTDNLNAKSIKEIAWALVPLAASLWLMGTIDSDKLGQALLAVSASLGIVILALTGLIALMNRGTKWVTAGFTTLAKGAKPMDVLKNSLKNLGKGVKTFFQNLTVGLNRFLTAGAILELAVAMIALAAAVLILSVAAKVFATMSWPELAKGLVGVAVALGLVIGAMVLVSNFVKTGPMIGLAASLIAIALGLIMLGAAVWLFANIDNVAAGITFMLGALAGLMVALIVLTNFCSGKRLIAAGAALLLTGAAILVLAFAVAAFAALGASAIDGIIGIAGALLAVGLAIGALAQLPAGRLIAAAGALLIVSVGVVAIAAALMILAWIPWDKLMFSVAMMGITVAVITIALVALSTVGPLALAAAAALLIVGVALMAIGAAFLIGSVGLIALAMAIQMMPDSSRIIDVAKGLKKLGGALIILGIGGALNRLGAKSYEALVPLATGLGLLELIDFNKLAPGLRKLGVAFMILGIGGLLMGVGALGLLLAIPGLTALAKVMPELAAGFQAFDTVNWGSVGKGVVALVGAIGALMLLQFATLADGSAQLANLAAVLPDLATGFASFEIVNAADLAASFGALAEGILALFALNVISLIGDGTPQLVEFANALPALAGGFSVFSDPTLWLSLPASAEALNTAIRSLFALSIVNLIGDGVPKLIELANAMPTVAAGFGAFTDPELWLSVPIATSALNSAISTLFRSGLATLIGDGVQSIRDLGEAMPVLAAGFSSFKDLEPAWIESVSSSLRRGIDALMGNALSDLFKSMPPFAELAAGLTSMGLALQLVPVDSEIRLTGLANGMNAIMGIVTENFLTISETISTTTQTIMTCMDDLALSADTNFTKIDDKVTAVMNNVERTVTDKFNMAKFQATSAATMMRINLSLTFSDIYNDISRTMGNIEGVIISVADNMSTYGWNIGINLANGIWEAVPYVEQAGYDLANAASIANSVSFSGYGGYSSGYSSGAYVTLGFTEGIFDGMSAVESAMAGMARGSYGSFAGEYEMASPSKLMMRSGGYVIQGFVNGIKNNSYKSEEAMRNAVDPMLAIINSLVTDDMDITPTITPVVDMSNVDNMAGDISDLLGGTGTYAVTTANRIAAAETANGAKFGTTADSSEVYSPTINIYTQPNQNSTEIANMVERKLVQMNKQRKLGALT